MRLSKLYFGITATALAAGIVLPTLPLVMPMWIRQTDVVTALAWIAVGFGLAGYISALALERGKSRALMRTGLMTGLAAFVFWGLAIILSLRYTDLATTMWVGTPLTGWTALMSFIGILEMLPVRERWAIAVRSATHVLAGVLTVFYVIVLCYFPVVDQNSDWQDRRAFYEITSRCGGVLGILTGCGTLVIVVASLLPRVSRDEVPLEERLELTIVCPRCAVCQKILTDGAACSACGLRIKVTPT